MLTGKVRQTYAILMFGAVGILLTAQVSWWLWVFQGLVTENARMKALLKSDPSLIELSQIHREADRKRTMFLSEAGFFIVVMGVGLYLLYRAWNEQEASHLKQARFIDVLSHETKTPLTSLGLRLELLRRSHPDLQELEDALGEVRRLGGIFAQTMALHRAENGALIFERVDLKEIIEDSVRQSTRQLSLGSGGEPRRELAQMDVPAGLLVNGDPTSLHSLFENLITNSLRYSGDKMVQVRAMRTDSLVRIFIGDNGPGIPPHERALVFDRFFRGQSSSGKSGTGLGLYLSRWIAKAHGGTLRVCDKNPDWFRGSGLLLELTLPSFDRGVA